ncbi:MarR family winged helix-turn-helix transcriptional regulator [Stappia sp. ES.058]|uniref:MarR family winged helix-turn-helix transcriptional regulator n=1 Tax=Stappia sp. ES.058 TaxID=1881061 RepID=UPI00087AED5B|nr:MarR family transcriptional regulator [Stappia sp. ES.058]SDU17058.1 transcriptional regulator, MarR family [Stappia sp. ES.058]
MTSAPPLLELETFLPYRLNILAETVSQSLAGVYRRRYGITVPEWRLIATLGQFGTVTAKGVGHHSCMHKTKVSRAAATLEARGLIRREPNSQDMRESFLALTAEGRAIYETLAPQARDFAQALVAGFSASDREVLDDLLQRLMLRARALTTEMAE